MPGYVKAEPLGILPRRLHREHRIRELKASVDRLTAADQGVPKWMLVEMKDLEVEIMRMRTING